MKYNYYLSRQLVTITSIVFLSQLFIEVTGVVERKPEFEFILPACAILWIISISYALSLIILNARKQKG